MEVVETIGATAAPEYSPLFVVLMGLGTVMFGLVCLVFICWLMGVLVRAFAPKDSGKDAPGGGTPAETTVAAAPAAAAAPAMRVAPCKIPNRGGFIAAVSAAIAEELGTDVSKLRILSVGREIVPGATPATEIPNRGAFVAAVSAAIAEDLGTDVSKLKIVSICEV
ncbi:MAG: OadG family protein [Clostridia bacterium]|nr:OadG family protein [Clostridia bacterium]